MNGTTSQDALDVFRPVPRTGVIYVMHEAMMRGFHYGHDDWANLGQGAPETGPIPDGTPRIDHVDLPDSVYEYAPVAGLEELREAVAALYNARYRRGMPSQYTADNVAISAGGRIGLTRLAASLGPVHLGHLLPDYTAYEELLEIFKAFVPIPIVLDREQGFTLPPDGLRSEIVGKGLGALLLSNPCNPTGQAVRGGALRAWVDICRELSCWMIVDEFYAHYLYGDAAASDGPSLSACRYVEDVDEDPVVVVDGLTKNWRYPGWRLSWTVGPKPIIERVASAGSFLDGGAPHPLQRAAIPLLDQEFADQEARAIQGTFSRKRQMVLDRIRAMGLGLANEPMGAFYAFATLDNLPPSLRDGMDFFRKALDYRVITVPGVFFDVDPGKRRSHIPSRLRQFVRLSFGPETDTVRSGLDRLDAMIREA
ncbi:MAG: pyridoxal phosphate-dependent aminotransferase [Myxococcota bacterium]